MAFEPGRSGNPAGRPRGKTLTADLRECLIKRGELLLKYIDKYDQELSLAKGRAFFEAYQGLMRDAFPKFADVEINELETLLESSSNDLLLEVRNFIKSRLNEQATNN